jgi:glycosyltransferase involved in cell wall biosynthesis
MKQPLISVIIPCYNHEKYIKKSIESVFNSNYDNIELLIIDDGSTDNSYEVAKNLVYSNSRLTSSLIMKQKNSGVVKTLNKLISMAHGDYIILLASDDVLMGNSIRERVFFLEKDKKYDAVIGKAILIDQNDNIISHDAGKYLYHADNILLRSKFIVEELVLRWSVTGPCLFARKSMYDRIGLYNEKYKVEDRDFYLRLLSKGNLKYLDTIVAGYRIHKGNNSRNIFSSLGIRIECAEINSIYGREKIFKNIILQLVLRSYSVDKILLKNNYCGLYNLYKIFRYFFVFLYLLTLKIIVVLNRDGENNVKGN